MKTRHTKIEMNKIHDLQKSLSSLGLTSGAGIRDIESVPPRIYLTSCLAAAVSMIEFPQKSGISPNCSMTCDGAAIESRKQISSQTIHQKILQTSQATEKLASNL